MFKDNNKDNQNNVANFEQINAGWEIWKTAVLWKLAFSTWESSKASMSKLVFKYFQNWTVKPYAAIEHVTTS